MKKLPAPIFITIAGILTLTAAQPVLAEDTEVLSVQTENAADQNQENDLSNADVICGVWNLVRRVVVIAAGGKHT